jgi:hypothetical protein
MTKTSLINYIYLYILYIIYISIYNYNWIFVFLFHLPLSFSANRKNILSLCHLSPAKGYEKLKRCVRSAETFSEEDIVSATQRQLTWTHLKSLMYIKDPLERQFYVSKSPDPDVTNIFLNPPINLSTYQKDISND